MRPFKDNWLIFGLVATAATFARAQSTDDTETTPNDAAPVADVHVDDSFDAKQVLTRADRLAARGDWVRAATELDQLIDDQAAKLVMVERGLYHSVVRAVRDQICKWPREGLAAYDRLFSARAREVLLEASQRKDLPALQAGLERYFCTSVGLALGDAAAELAMDQEQFQLAGHIYRDLAQVHPDAAARAAEFRAKQAIATALAGDVQQARALLADDSAKPAETTITWLGTDRTAADIVSEIQRTCGRKSSISAAEQWPTQAGSFRRNQKASLRIQQPALLWQSAALFAPAATEPAHDGFWGHELSDPSLMSALDHYPIHADGLIFDHDRSHVRAVRADDGVTVWSYQDELADQASASEGSGDVAAWHGATWDHGRLYAALGGESMPYYGYDHTECSAALVCLDGKNGRLIWRYDGAADRTEYADVEFDGSPVVRGDTLCVVERRRRSFGFEDCFLLGIDALSGRVRWRAHLGSASVGGFGYRRPTMTMAAMDDSNAYVMTNLGTIASVSVNTGAVRWLRVYPREAAGDSPRGTGNERSWNYNPLILDGGKLYCLPTDAARLMIVDADIGRIETEIATDELADVNCLYGVADGCIYGTGREAFSYRIDQRTLSWSKPLSDHDRFRGRGLLTDRAMVVPTVEGISTFDLDDGSRRDYPSAGQWGGGNLLVAGETLIVAGPTGLADYADKEKVWRRLQERMDRESDDPSPALDLAGLAFRSGDTDTAVNLLHEATRRAARLDAATRADSRRRVFVAATDFADMLEQRLPTEASVWKRQRDLLMIAGQCAPDDAAQVDYRLRLATVLERSDQSHDAVELYQQILDDPALRGVNLVGEDVTSPEMAGQAARERIDRLIDAHGRVVYQRFDADAQALLDRTLAASDLGALEKVRDQYPNSIAAVAALRHKGRMLKTRGRYIEAARSFYDAAYSVSAPSMRDRAELMLQIAGCHQAANQLDVAAGWLDLLLQDLEAGAKDLDDVTALARRQRAELVARSGQPARSAQRLVMPLREAHQHTYSDSLALLSPEDANASDASRPAYYLYHDGGVSAHSPETAAELWGAPAPVRMLPTLLSANRNRVILATPFEITSLDAGTGRRLWSFGQYPPNLDDAVADPEDFSRFRFHAFDDSRLVLAADDGRLSCIDLTGGKLVWSQVPDVTVTDSPVLRYGAVAIPARRSGETVCMILDAGTGRRRATTTLAADQQITAMTITSDQHVITAAGAALWAWDAVTGDVAWRRSWQRRIAPASLLADVDGVYVSPGGSQIEKLRLTDGRTIWSSELMTLNSGTSMRLQVINELLLAINDTAIIGFDLRTGRRQMEPAIPAGITPASVMINGNQLVLIDADRFDENRPATAYCFNLSKDKSLSVPGLSCELGKIGDARGAVLAGNALIIQDGNSIVGWTSQP